MKTTLPLKEFISENAIKQRIKELGQAITRDFAGQELTVVAVLKGSVLFFTDIIREIDLSVTVDFLEVSSYGDETKSTGVIRINKDLTHSIEGHHVLIVEDIIDTGLTMKYLLENLRTRKPKSMKVCALLVKKDKFDTSITVDYPGFEIEDKFVVGYGLDYKGRCRNINYIGYVEA